MFFKILLNYILGYINIKVESFYIERFINLCTNKKILLWNIKRNKSTILYAKIGIKEFKRIKEIAQNTDSKITIEEKKGLPIILNKYKKRKVFAILLGCIIIGLIAISQFIWNIEVISDKQTDNNQIMNQLKEAGIKIGMPKSKIDLAKSINKIRLQRDDIAWIGINIKGTNVIVKMVFKKDKPVILDKNEYCNIISDKEGMITKINVQNGTALVKEGDIVKEGTVLIGGYLEGKYTGLRYVHSMADIEAKVWYTKKGKFTYNQLIKKPTGDTETKYQIKFNNFTINFYKILSKFKNYDTIEESKKIYLFSNFYLPIQLVKIVHYEYNEEQVIFTEEQLIENAKKKLTDELLKDIDKDSIINEQVNVYNESDGLEVEVIYEAIEKIGTEEKIVY